MTNLSDAMPAPGATAAPPRPTRPLYWSLRRELWEHASVYIAPVSAAGVVLLGFLLSAIGMAHRRLTTLTLPPAKQAALMGMPYDMAAAALLLTMMIVAIFYCLSALQNERRDRSILFWKSLPVSDLTAVTAKAIVALAIVPAVTFCVILLTQAVIFLMSTVMLVASGVSPAVPWTPQSVFEGLVVLFYGEVTFTLWIAPIYGWLLLVSGWARRGAFLWAVLPPLALSLIERLAFGTTYLWRQLTARLSGGFEEAFVVLSRHAVQANGGIPSVGLAQIDVAKFASNPAVWLGLVFAAACFAGAVWLRRYRDPS